MIRIFLSLFILLSGLFSASGVFAAENQDTTEVATGQVIPDKEAQEQQKERAKTIDNINTFLIESYKIKIDKIFSNLSISLEKATQNDPAVQIKLLKKMRGDITVRMNDLDTKDISTNRKKILSAVFSYIQKNIDDSINNLAKK